MISEDVLEKLEFNTILTYISKYTSTEIGKNIILSTRPFSSLNTIIEEGNFVSEAKNVLIEKDYPPFVFVPDLYNQLSTSNIEGSILSQSEIKSILTLAETSRKIFVFFKQTENSNLFKKIANGLFVDKVFENHIASIFTSSGEISDNASPELKKIRQEIRTKSNTLKQVVNKILKKLSDAYLVQEDYITQRDGRIVLPIKAEHKRHVKGFIHSESSTGQTVYIEPEESLELNNDILTLTFAEKREIERILKNITIIIGNSSNRLKHSLNILGKLDAIFAKGKYSLEIIGAFPSFYEDEPLTLIDARHPILIKRLTREKVVPLNLKIDKDNVILITGPNAGGKTVVIKTIGLLSALALSGIHIPAAADSNLHFFKDIFLDIGDEQSIENDLSTFSSHLSNLNYIVNNAGSKTLILLDEIGTGTDPEEGAALAAALLMALKNSRAKVLATTHHGNLKLLAHNLDGFQNASMKFDTDNLKPTYEFRQGLPGSSYAFEIAKKIGLSDPILQNARQHLDVDKNKIESFLVEIEKKSYELNKKLKSLEIENARLKGLAKLYVTKINNLKAKQAEILTQTSNKAKLFLEGINKKFELTIKNIRESEADKKVIKQEKEKLLQLKQDVEKFYEPVTTDRPLHQRKLKVADFVKLKDSTTSGIITEIDEQKKRATITSGNLKLNVKLSNLELAKRKKDISEFKAEYNPYIPNTRLDIRGRKPEEVEFEVIKFIDDSYAANIDRVEILHGKGTGILKSSVQELLKKHSLVRKFYFADIEIGGEGITIVELK